MRSADNFKLKNEGTKFFVDVIGDLDEETNFKNLHLPNASEIVVNFEGVSRIQSCGIREWVQAFFPYRKAKVIFEKCPKMIVDQMNMLEGFLPKGSIVESFYVPYYSEEYGTEKMVLFRRGIEFDENGIYPPTNIRDEQGHPLEMDVLEEKYFKFLNHP